MTTIIAAIAHNNALGKDNDLIWHLPKDMQFFKEKTTGHHVIMGRKNFESIPHKFRPLPNRTNIIITRQSDYKAEDSIVVNSVEEALKVAKSNGENEAFIIGGGQIYKLALDADLVDRIYLTRIHHSFDGDTFFPELNSDWEEVNREDCFKDERNKYNYSFIVLEKK